MDQSDHIKRLLLYLNNVLAFSFQDSREQLEKVRQIKIFQYKYKPEFVSLSDEDQRKCDVARLKRLI